MVRNAPCEPAAQGCVLADRYAAGKAKLRQNPPGRDEK